MGLIKAIICHYRGHGSGVRPARRPKTCSFPSDASCAVTSSWHAAARHVWATRVRPPSHQSACWREFEWERVISAHLQSPFCFGFLFKKKKKQNTPGASPRSNYTHLGSFVKLRLWIRQRWTNAVNLPGKNTSNRILSRRSKLSPPKWMHKNKNSIRHRHFKRHSKESIDPPLVWLELSFASRREDASVSRSILGTDF